MESTQKPLRLRLILGKFRVVDVTKNLTTGFTIKIALGGSTTMTCCIPIDHVDIKPGDLLTFYTEVLTHAHVESPPQQ